MSAIANITTNAMQPALVRSVLAGNYEETQAVLDQWKRKKNNAAAGDDSLFFGVDDEEVFGVDDEGSSGLNYAAHYGEQLLVEIILDALYPIDQQAQDNNASDSASADAGAGQLVAGWWVAEALTKRNKRKHNALHMATLGSSPRTVEQLCIHAGRYFPVSGSGDSILAGDYDEFPASPVLRLGNHWNETALHLACSQGDTPCVKVLLKYGGPQLLTCQDAWSRTAIDIALSHGHAELGALLKALEQDARTTTVTKEAIVQALDVHLNPLVEAQVAAKKRATTPTLVNGVPATSQPRILSKMIEAPLDESQFSLWLADESIDSLGKDYYGNTAAHKCAAWNKSTCLLRLIDKHRDADLCAMAGQGGNTPLHCALEAGAVDCAKLLVKRASTRALCVANNDGILPIHMAVMMGQEEVAQLLAPVIDVTAQTAQGMNAMQLARQLPFPEPDVQRWLQFLSRAARSLPRGSDHHNVQDREHDIADIWLQHIAVWHEEQAAAAKERASRTKAQPARRHLDSTLLEKIGGMGAMSNPSSKPE